MPTRQSTIANQLSTCLQADVNAATTAVNAEAQKAVKACIALGVSDKSKRLLDLYQQTVSLLNKALSEKADVAIDYPTRIVLHAKVAVIIDGIQAYLAANKGEGRESRQVLRENIEAYQQKNAADQTHCCYPNIEALEDCLQQAEQKKQALHTKRLDFAQALTLCQGCLGQQERVRALVDLDELDRLLADVSSHKLRLHAFAKEPYGESVKRLIDQVTAELDSQYRGLDGTLVEHRQTIEKYLQVQSVSPVTSEVEVPTTEHSLTYRAIKDIVHCFMQARHFNKDPWRLLKTVLRYCSSCVYRTPMATGAQRLQDFVDTKGSDYRALADEDMTELAEIFKRRIISNSWAAARKGDEPFQSQYLFVCIAQMALATGDGQFSKKVLAALQEGEKKPDLTSKRSRRSETRLHDLFQPRSAIAREAYMQSATPG